jgi:hypothetical protein
MSDDLSKHKYHGMKRNIHMGYIFYYKKLLESLACISNTP